MSRLPYWQFFTGDLLKDPSWRMCSWQAQNLWIRILIHLHEMPYRGQFLMRDGVTPMSEEIITKILEMPITEYRILIQQLLDNGVADILNNCLSNRRMVRERQLRENKSKAGKKGMESRYGSDNRTIADYHNGSVTENLPSIPFHPNPSHSNPLQLQYKNEDICDPKVSPSAEAKLSVEEIRSRWNSIQGIRPCKKIAAGLEKKIKHLSKDHDMAWWDALFMEVSQSKFLTGRASGTNGHKPFRANLDWVTGPTNLGKVLAGNYTDDSSPLPKRGVM